MKTFMLLTALSVIILSGCSTSKSTADYDDVYSTTKKSSGTAASENDQTQVTSPDYYQESSETVSGLNPEEYETGEDVTYGNEPYLTTTETVTTPEGTNYITNNYYEGYGTDDYYDYSYASRIDRFYSPYMGYSYYAPYYSNYYDPWYWDSYWYRPSFYFGMSWGWGGMYYGYPYYSYYYPYNDYWYGYNNGYWNGYYDGYYGYGYNDYYGSNYYGHRGDRSGSSNSGTTTSKDISSVVQNGSRPNYFERTTPQLAENLTPGRTSTNSNEGAGRQSTNSKSNQNVLVVDPQSNQQTAGRGSDLNVSGNQQDPIGRSNINSAVESGKNVTEKMNSRIGVQDQSKGSGSSSRYTYKKPAVNSNASKEGYKPGQTIENNNNSRPSQKYTKPGTQSSSNGKVSSSPQGTNTGNQNRQTYSKPQSNSNNSYSRPSGYHSNSQPSRSSNNTYSQPSRTNTNSQPSNSSKSYSQPSRSSSSGSYSSPSRSSSSGSYSSPSRSSSSSGSSSRSSSGGGSSSGGSRGGRK